MPVDILTYNYDSGNKLLGVKDGAYPDPIVKDKGFKDGTNSGNDYTYDINGNLLSDANKRITNIKYNHLNLPTGVDISNNGSSNITYAYDATGNKLAKTVTSKFEVTMTKYAGNYIYKNNKLEFFNHPEGYVTPENDGTFKYVYQYKDHLNNVRLSYTDANNDGNISTSEIIEEKNYYPFGLKHKGYNTAINGVHHKYEMYNGKEYEETLGLNLYEMDVRMYDPAIARFNGIDPITHFSQGTSVAFDNNPVTFSDPSGADSESFINNLFKRSSNGEKWTNNNDGTFSSNKGQTAQCDDCEGVVRVKVAEPRNTTVSDRAKNWFNPMVDTYFKLEYGDGAYSEFLIDSEGYISIDLNNLVVIHEANVVRAISFLRALSKYRTAGNLIKLVRNSNWIKNTKLRGVLSQFYRVNATIGNGSSAAALMHEARAEYF